jgi:hypothetical protein
MPQSCRICTHVDARAIDAELLANRDSLRSLAAQYGVSKDSLTRHFHTHLERSEPRQISEPQSASAEPDPSLDRYYAFVDCFRGKRVSRAEVATWGYSPEEVEAFVEVALECGDLRKS